MIDFVLRGTINLLTRSFSKKSKIILVFEVVWNFILWIPKQNCLIRQAMKKYPFAFL